MKCYQVNVWTGKTDNSEKSNRTSISFFTKIPYCYDSQENKMYSLGTDKLSQKTLRGPRNEDLGLRPPVAKRDRRLWGREWLHLWCEYMTSHSDVILIFKPTLPWQHALGSGTSCKFSVVNFFCISCTFVSCKYQGTGECIFCWRQQEIMTRTENKTYYSK